MYYYKGFPPFILSTYMATTNLWSTHMMIHTPCVSKLKNTFGQNMHDKIKVTFGEISLKLCQTNRTLAINNVNFVADELPSQITVYACTTIDNWTRRRQHT
jgi:hypothetical protein